MVETKALVGIWGIESETVGILNGGAKFAGSIGRESEME